MKRPPLEPTVALPTLPPRMLLTEIVSLASISLSTPLPLSLNTFPLKLVVSSPITTTSS